MFVDVAVKSICRKCVALLVRLFLAANLVQGTVLCFGADGHIEFESAFHGQCTNHAHSCSHGHSGPAGEADQEEGKHCHCGPCVDVPVDAGIAKLSQTTQQLDRAFAAITADVSTACEQPCYLERNPVSNAFIATSYFTPLRTIILLA